MNRNSLLITTIITMFIFGLQIAEPAAAASLKVIDHGSHKFNENNINTIYKWTTYQKGVNYVKVVEYSYCPQHKTKEYGYTYFQKVSATKMKAKQKIFHYYGDTYCTEITKLVYIHTKLTAVKYYWKKVRPNMLAHP